MEKLILLSVIFATVVVPVTLARRQRPRTGWSETVAIMVVFNALYFFTLYFVYERIL